MGERKVVSRNIAVVLGVACIVLVVGLGGAITNYTLMLNSKDSAVALANSTIDLLNSQITNLQSQISNLQTQISNLQKQNNSATSQNSNLQSQIDSLNSQYNTLNAEYAKLQNDYLGMLGVKNGTYLAYYNRVAVLNYSWSMAMNGLTRQYSAIMDIYNFESGCSISVKLYSPTQGTSITFNYTMPSGYKEFVETWDTGWSTAYYPNITIQNVQR